MAHCCLELWKILCRNNRYSYRIYIFLRVNRKQWIPMTIVAMVLFLGVLVYTRSSKNNPSFFSNMEQSRAIDNLNCEFVDRAETEDRCSSITDLNRYRGTFYSPHHHVKVDFYGFQCNDGWVKLLFDLSFYSKQWFPKQEIVVIIEDQNLCQGIVNICHRYRCDQWQPKGDVQSMVNGSSTVIDLSFNSIVIKFRLFEMMFAYRAIVRTPDRMNSITMQTKFNINRTSEKIDGDAFMDGGEESGFMHFNLNENARSLAKRWSRTIQHLPWTVDLHTNHDRIVSSISEVCNFGAINARMSFIDDNYSIRSGLLLRTTYNFLLSQDRSKGGLQWIAWLLADTPKNLANLASFPGLLCPPPFTSEDFSWVKPGKVLRDMSLSTQTSKALMNFSQNANIDYILLDAGYYGPENNASSDPLRPLSIPRENPLNISEVVQYGKNLAQPIGVILYVNDIALSKGKDRVEEIAKTFVSWGVSGIKMGFVQVKRQFDMERVLQNIQIFGRHRLLVNVHDSFRDNYISRTLPYLLSCEGVSGDEHAENPPNHALILPFTRLLAGRTDHTFTLDWSRLHQKKETMMFQIALPYILPNGLQHLYWYRDSDSLARLGTDGPLTLWKSLPKEYQRSMVFTGEIGVYIGVIRQEKDGKWFLIYVTTVPKLVKISWDFLPQSVNDYLATIYEDVEQNYTIPRHILPKIKIRRCLVKKEIEIPLTWNSAFVIRIEKTEETNIPPC